MADGAGDGRDGDGDGNATLASGPVIKGLSYAMVAVLMLGLACAVRVRDVRRAARARATRGAFAAALACQWLLVPAAARAVVALLALPPLPAVACVMIACCPGGTLSNALAYFCRGDLALSLVITMATNTLAVGTLPLLLQLHVGAVSGGAVAVPVADVAAAMLLVLVPAAAGLYLRERHPRWAATGEKVGAAVAGVVIVSTVVVSFATNAEVLLDADAIPARTWAALSLMSPLAMALAMAVTRGGRWLARKASGGGGGGASAASASGGGRGCARAVADALTFTVAQEAAVILETGVQNVPLAIAIVNISFADNPDVSAREFFKVQLVPMVYGLTTGACAVTVAYLYSRYTPPRVAAAPAAAEPAAEPAAEEGGGPGGGTGGGAAVAASDAAGGAGDAAPAAAAEDSSSSKEGRATTELDTL